MAAGVSADFWLELLDTATRRPDVSTGVDGPFAMVIRSSVSLTNKTLLVQPMRTTEILNTLMNF